MSVLKYTIPEISAYSILSAAVETKNGYRFSFDATDPSKSYMVEETKQDDCPIFYQAMRVLGYNEKDLGASEKLRDVFVFIDFSGIFDRKPVGKVLEAQKKAEYMFRPEGINIFFGKQEYRYIAFERSASMSRQSRLSFIREDIYEALRERMMLGMNIGQCQLSKLYAYNALLFTDGRRYRDDSLLSSEHIVVIDNPKSIVKNAPVITVEDDGTDNPVRKYHRVEKTTDIEITEFDGEGLVSAELAYKIDDSENHLHHSFQIRLPYIKGVVHEVDFRSLFAEFGVSEITDIWGNRHRVSGVELIINKSMFKGFGWMTENGLSFAEYLDRCRKYDHALYISGTDKVGVQKTTELNYQFLNTLAVTEEEFRPKDLPWGWTHTPEWDRRQWVTKTTETEYFSLIGDHGSRRDYFIANLDREDLSITDRRRIRAELVKKNGLWVDEPIYSKELEDKAEQILSKYGVGQLLVAGNNRYLSDDLMRLLSYIVRTSGGDSAVLDAECLSGNTVYAPMPGYVENETYTLLRSPHIANAIDMYITETGMTVNRNDVFSNAALIVKTSMNVVVTTKILLEYKVDGSRSAYRTFVERTDYCTQILEKTADLCDDDDSSDVQIYELIISMLEAVIRCNSSDFISDKWGAYKETPRLSDYEAHSKQTKINELKNKISKIKRGY